MRKELVIPSRKHDWGNLPTGWESLPDTKDTWGDLPMDNWKDLPTGWGEPTPEEQKAWKDELASLPTLDELMNKPPVKGQKKGGNNEK